MEFEDNFIIKKMIKHTVANTPNIILKSNLFGLLSAQYDSLHIIHACKVCLRMLPTGKPMSNCEPPSCPRDQHLNVFTCSPTDPTPFVTCAIITCKCKSFSALSFSLTLKC